MTRPPPPRGPVERASSDPAERAMRASGPGHPDPDLVAAQRRLALRFADIAPETIRAVLDETYGSMRATSTVTRYLPLLAERAAAARLASLASE